MHRSGKSDKPGWWRKIRVLATWGALGMGAGLAGGGCSTTPLHSNDKVGDPLLGPAPPTTPAPSHAGLPPIPPTDGLTTNAALAAQTAPPQSLAIGNSDGWMRKVDGVPASSNTLKPPMQPVSQPKVVPVPKDSGFTALPVDPIQATGSWSTASVPPSNVPPSSGLPSSSLSSIGLPSNAPPANVPTLDQLKQLLDSRGVIGQKQYPDPAGVRLDCIVPNPANANSNLIYSTTAIDYATAVQAIVHEIDAGHAK